MNSRLLVAAAAVLLAVAVPTAAVTVAGDGPADQEADLVTLAPHEGPNGAYASVDDGELTVAFDRLNDRGRTIVDEVFTVTADTDGPVSVWVTVDDAGGDVYRGDEPGTALDSRQDAVTLQPGESVAVGFAIDTTGSAPAADAVTVHAEPVDQGSTEPGGSSGDADFVVTDLSAPAEATTGEPVQIAATVENVGDADGEYLARLVVDGTVVDSRTVTVPAGETRTVTVERTFDAAGEYELVVGDRSRTITVVRPPEPSAEFETSEARILDDEISAGDSTEVAVTVENVGDAPGETTVELVIGGTVVDSETVELEPGERTTVTFEWSFRQAGVYQVGVGGLDAGKVTVLSGADAEGRQLSSSLQTAAAGPVLVLLLLVLAWRYRRG